MNEYNELFIREKKHGGNFILISAMSIVASTIFLRLINWLLSPIS